MINLSVNSLNSLNTLYTSNLSKNTNSLATALQRMSTGCKINTAKDDASGYALSQKLLKAINGDNRAY